ncbi:NAD(P)/FAD-dependent oxidoreductase [Streptomyces sp. NPDC054796]
MSSSPLSDAMADSAATDAPDIARAVVVGAGPAGLTAAWKLCEMDEKPLVLEADGEVGGLSRTVEREGWRFDIGGHRFYTRLPQIEDLWEEFLPPGEFLTRTRKSRIFYEGSFFDYPLAPMNALRGLGFWEAVRCIASYARARLSRRGEAASFEDWVVARFGRRLYDIFFKTYTEKVWGIPGSAIGADWAAQRIGTLSLGNAILDALQIRRSSAKSLTKTFKYPRLGPGMMWENVAGMVREKGGSVLLEAPVSRIHHENGRVTSVLYDSGGEPVTQAVSSAISTIPLTALIAALDPPPDDRVLSAARGLRYRDFLTVAIVLKAKPSFDDNWIYIHSRDVKVGRIQNYEAWSADMVRDGTSCLGLEYFVTVGDELWNSSDASLGALASREIVQLGLASEKEISHTYVVRMRNAYPVYDETYRENLKVVRDWLTGNCRNLQTVGRNGLHRYNNQDHSMHTALLGVENLLGIDQHDLWDESEDSGYLEQPSAPARTTAEKRTRR